MGEDLTSPWRMVLKVVHLPDLTGTPLETGYINAPEDWNYWRREVLARRSGLPDRFTSPLRPGLCWATEEVDDTTAWLWLEELAPMPHPPVFTLAELATAAHDLGAFAAQGVLHLDDIQRMPWAARDWLRGWFATAEAMGGRHAVSHEGCWGHPLVRDRLPASVGQSFVALMEAAEPLFGHLDRLPRTVAHLDAQASNLFPESVPEGRRTVLIDWGFMGEAPIGEDLGHHIALNVYAGAVDPADAEEHEATATQAYLGGLREYGWNGNAEDVRFAAMAAGALRMLPFAACHLAGLCPAFGEPDRWPEDAAEEQGRDIDTIMDAWCEAVTHLAGMADRARLLLGGD